MRVLGVDPGSRRTGFGVVERRGNAYACLDHGHVAPPSGSDLPARLHCIARTISSRIEQWRPDAVVVEEAFHARSVRSTLVLGHVRGALLLIATQAGTSIAEYSPRSIKLAVTGNGAADKSQVEFMIRRLLGIPGPITSDAADALAAAVCHLSRRRFDVPGRRTPASMRLEALMAGGRNSR